MAIIKKKKKKQEITSVDEDAEKRKPLCTVSGNVIDAATMKNTMETTIWSRSPTSGYLTEENKNTNLKRYIHSYVHCSIIYSSQDMETT